jgi:imidazoleglycerol-phosphate dehydratase
MRRALLERQTRETDIRVSLDLDGRGRVQVRTGIRFFDHMLEQVGKHGLLDLRIEARGDLDVDQHHTVEDVGLALGAAVSKALGARRGIHRAGYFVMPMDEALAVAALDLCGRPYCRCAYRIRARRVGDLQSELIEDFFRAFANAAGAALHLRILEGRSSHHMAEALFKCFARALGFAVSRDRRLKGALPSTKGLL